MRRRFLSLGSGKCPVPHQYAAEADANLAAEVTEVLLLPQCHANAAENASPEPIGQTLRVRWAATRSDLLFRRITRAPQAPHLTITAFASDLCNIDRPAQAGSVSPEMMLASFELSTTAKRFERSRNRWTRSRSAAPCGSKTSVVAETFAFASTMPNNRTVSPRALIVTRGCWTPWTTGAPMGEKYSNDTGSSLVDALISMPNEPPMSASSSCSACEAAVFSRICPNSARAAAARSPDPHKFRVLG